ncbi:BREX system P-loop protein BrxC [Fusobacterium sp. PH5-44]|uniref:BREX system P-loop protein BrxC n=1 Tax=unclassified Fusobacterium TaxID=2648384 RepID=UPI003D1B38BB
MEKDLKIKDLFKKDITRKINGVVKADQTEESVVITELEEYVVTEELRKHFTELFDKYVDSLNSRTEDIGVWISGFYGSGKSHFLKMIGRILENKEYNGKKVTDFFKDKIKDSILQGNLEKVSDVPTDVILFNVDNVSDQDTHQNKDSIVIAFLKNFNGYLGFSKDDLKIAEFERDLWERGILDEFKLEFEKESGKSWKEGSRILDFHADEFLDVVEKMNIRSREAATIWLEKDVKKSESVESFTELLESYLKKKDKKHRIVFLVDEIGQYIGSDSRLMLNLQTLVETLGVKFQGRVWVGVTSQQKIDEVIEGNKNKRNDFSKIQDRFKTMLALSSGNIDEVIKKRLLEKKEIDKEEIEKSYDKKRIEIENLINFTGKGQTQIIYKDKLDFAETYPFVGYQFYLLQKVFERIREMGHSGQHMSRGERSLLSSFQEAAIRVADKDVGILVPFNYFYESIEQFLEDIARRPFIHAKNNLKIDDFSLEVLKLLFLLRGNKDVESNISNLVSFMVDSIDCDRIGLESQIKKALDILEREILIQKDGDQYYFLTNEEQDINREINQEEVDAIDISKAIDSFIFGEIFTKNTIVMEDTGNKYDFTRNIDDDSFGKSTGQLNIVIFTPNADNYENVQLIGIRSEYDLIVRLPESKKSYLDEIKQSLKVESFIKRSSRESKDSVREILMAKERENVVRKRRIKNEIEEVLSEADVFVGGHKFLIKARDGAKVIEESLKGAADYRFKFAKLVKLPYDESRIRGILDTTFEGANMLFDINNDLESNQNVAAIKEVLERLKLQKNRDITCTVKTLGEYFIGAPYGWDQFTVNGIIAELWIYKNINLSESKEAINNPSKLRELLTKTQTRTLERIEVTLKEEIDIELIKKVNNLLKKLFGLDESKGITPDSPKEQLFEILNKKQDLGKYLKEYHYGISYPGEKELSNWISLISEVTTSKEKPEKILKLFLDMEDELLESLERKDVVADFFDTTKREKYDIAIKMKKKIAENVDSIGSLQEKDAYKKIVEILDSKNMYSRLREIDDLIKILDEEEKKLIEIEKNELLLEIKGLEKGFIFTVSGRDILKEKFKGELDKFTDEIGSLTDISIFSKKRKLENIIKNLESEYKAAIKKELNDIESNLIKSLEDKDDVGEILREIKTIFGGFVTETENSNIENLEKIIEKANKDKEDFILQGDGKSKKRERVSIKKVIVSAKYNVETVSQVESYIGELEKEIEQLKSEMLKAIKENKIVDIS